MESKVTLRKNFAAKRNSMDREAALCKSEVIRELLLDMPQVRDAHTILLYASCGREVSTHELIAELLCMEKDVRLPTVRDDSTLAWSRVQALEDLAPGFRGILEPKNSLLDNGTPPTDALVIVPGVAFTRAGDRLGRGGGHFDRFLQHHKGPKLALAFELQLVDSLPTEVHDIRMDAVITEETIYLP